MWQFIAVSLKWRRGEGFFSSLEVTKRNDGTLMRYNQAADTPWLILFPAAHQASTHHTPLFFPLQGVQRGRQCNASTGTQGIFIPSRIFCAEGKSISQ